MSNMKKEPTSSRGGYLYLIHCAKTSYYKIGVCMFADTDIREEKNIENRRVSLQVGCPFELVRICIVCYPSYVIQHERAIHNKYWKKRVRGEWFEFTEEEIVDVIKEVNNTNREVKKRHKS